MRALFRAMHGPCAKGCCALQASLTQGSFLDVGQGEPAVSILKSLSKISVFYSLKR